MSLRLITFAQFFELPILHFGDIATKLLNICDMFGITDEYIEHLVSRELIDPDDPEKTIIDQLADAEMYLLMNTEE